MTESRWQPSAEQRQVLETWNQGLAIMAGAGSGKTTTLVQKCLELCRTRPEAKFAAVSFTERSASDLRQKLTLNLGVAPELKGHWVMTIHGLCSRVISEFPRESGFEGDEGVLSESEAGILWEHALDGLWQSELDEPFQDHLNLLLDREGRAGLDQLLKRVKDLELFGVMDSLLKSDDPATQALSEVSSWVMDRYTRSKNRRGALDFNDLERGADRALAQDHVSRLLQSRFDLILVDEFQDTNPVQARLIWRMVKEGGKNLCVVGDPKQSIYRFRDADVSVFEEFCQRLPVQVSLTRNFRSRPEILDLSNEVCSRSFEAASLKYEALIAERKSSSGEADYASVEKLPVTSPADLARWILGQVDSGIPLSDMALLVRKIRGNEAWFKALSAAGIPIAVGSGGLFWEDPRVRELVAFLKWWDHPQNALSGATFLRAPWVGVSDSELDGWIQSSPSGLDTFFDSPHPLAQALKALRFKTLRPAELLLALLISSETEAELGAQVIGLWHRAEELSSSGLSFHAVVLEFDRSVRESHRERDVPPPKNLGQLLVLTLHGAKGLEFPHVILLDLPVKPERARPSPLLYWDRQKGAFVGTSQSNGKRDEKDPGEIEWRADERRKSVAESMRLLYVALTRAQERLVLVWQEEAESRVPKSIYESDFWRGWIEQAGMKIPEAKFLPIQERPSLSTVEMPPVISQRQRIPSFKPRHSVTQWNTLSRCPRAYEWTYVRPVQIPESEPAPIPETKRTGISQQELGTRVHSCLERGDFAGLRELETELGPKRFLARPLELWAKNSPWMKGSDPSKGRRVWPELNFEVNAGSQALVGSMDRVISEDQFELLDFKITQSLKSHEQLLEAYQTQMSIYAYALTQLAPQAKGRIHAHLVAISPQGVQSFPVALGDLSKVERLAEEAAMIVAGEPGQPRPGLLCRVCPFKSVCPESDPLSPRMGHGS